MGKRVGVFCVAALLGLSGISAAQTANVTMWQPAGVMGFARAGHAVARLASGKVLVTGGFDLSVASEEFGLATAEVFDPATNMWSPAAPMQTRRVFPAFVVLADGRVLVAGGQHSAGAVMHATAEIYDPVANVWSPAASMSIPRVSATATLLGDGRVLVAGGGTPYDAENVLFTVAATAEIYDPQSNTWTPAGAMSVPHAEHRALRLTDGRVIVIAGSTVLPSEPTHPVATAAVDIFNPATNSWSLGASLPASRYNFVTATLGDGRILLAGNGIPNPREALIYDPVGDAWSFAPDMKTPRGLGAAVSLPDGRALVAGGEFINTLPGIPPTDPTAEIYDPATNAWTTAGTMFNSPWYPSMTLLGDGRVLVAGGCCETIDPPFLAWSSTQVYGPASCPADITASLDVFTSGMIPYLQTPFRFQLVLVRNRSMTAFTGPLSYLTDDLQLAAGVTAASTRCQPAGMKTPYFRVTAGADNVLSPGEYQLGLILLYQTVEGTILYTPRVLAGIPVR